MFDQVMLIVIHPFDILMHFICSLYMPCVLLVFELNEVLLLYVSVLGYMCILVQVLHSL